MASIDTIEIHDDYPFRGKRERRYKVGITNNSLVTREHILAPVLVDVSDDGTAAADVKLISLADIEVSTGADIISEYQDQADYDRRALGTAMILTDVDDFHDVLPLFEAMELRGGNNAGQRAAYLGVSAPSYGDMEERFNNDQGSAFFLDNRKDLIWEELPPEWL